MKNLKKLLSAITALGLSTVSAISVVACGSGKKPTPPAQKTDISDKIPGSIKLGKLNSDTSTDFLEKLQEKLKIISSLESITTDDYDVYKTGTETSITSTDIEHSNSIAVDIKAKGDNFSGTQDNITVRYIRIITQQETIYINSSGNQETTSERDLSKIDSKKKSFKLDFMNTEDKFKLLECQILLKKYLINYHKK